MVREAEVEILTIRVEDKWIVIGVAVISPIRVPMEGVLLLVLPVHIANGPTTGASDVVSECSPGR